MKWARQNFRRKLKPSTISAFELEVTFLDQNTPSSPNSSSTFSTTIPIVVSPPSSPKPSLNPSKHSSKTIPTAKPSTSTTKPSTCTPKPQPSTSKSYAEAVRAMGSNTDKAHSIRITGEQNPLSNLYKCTLNSQGAVWHSVENLYQYQRAIFRDQGELSDQIISATNAHQVLQIAKFLPYSPLWDKHKLSFMDTLLELNYEQCKKILSKTTLEWIFQIRTQSARHVLGYRKSRKWREPFWKTSAKPKIENSKKHGSPTQDSHPQNHFFSSFLS